jgi:catechol 2,3-dioxygenase-like lactoylglutathione lyase family enzyme
VARALGINHVALEVHDLEEAVSFYVRAFAFELRGRVPGMAFLDMGDQFLALSEGRSGDPDVHRHLGLVVDDLESARRKLQELGAELLPGRGLDFRDPSGNRVQVVAYSDIQFTKDAAVLEGMGAGTLEKSDQALKELTDKGLL